MGKGFSIKANFKQLRKYAMQKIHFNAAQFSGTAWKYAVQFVTFRVPLAQFDLSMCWAFPKPL